MDRFDRTTVKIKCQYLLYQLGLFAKIRLPTSRADSSADVFRQTFRDGGACIESGHDRFLLLNGGILDSVRIGGVVGGVSNASSEEELWSIRVGSLPVRAFAASDDIIGESSNTSALAKSSAISWSG